MNAGLSSSDAGTLTQISGAESRYGANVVSGVNTNGSQDYGVFQINNSAWPQFGGATVANQDLATQAQEAAHIWNTQGAGAWSTYNSGVYQSYDNGASGGSGGLNSLGPASASDIASTDQGGNSLGYPAYGIDGTTSSGGIGYPSLTTQSLSAGQDYVAPGTYQQLPPAVTAAADTQAAGAEKSAGITGGWLSGITTSAETFLGKAFVVTALVVMGVVFVAFGLGLFNKKMIAGMVA